MTVNRTPHAPLIGRHAESALLRESFADSDVRLVTLTGFAGVGKTHFAATATVDLASSFADGAFFISLDNVWSAEQLLPAIARGIGLCDSWESVPTESLYTALRAKETLLTLDKFEQLTEAATELDQLLKACPNLKVLVTSQMPLRLAGEMVIQMSPLPAPDPSGSTTFAELAENEAVRLFVSRAQANDPSFSLTEANAHDIASICAKLDGVPLAIELAAARLQVLSPSALMQRLATAFSVLVHGNPPPLGRHSSLRAALASSEELLSPPTRSLFRFLSVFAGGFDAEAVEFVRGKPLTTEPNAEPAKDMVLNGLSELLDHGLLRRDIVAGVPRFAMSKTIAAYAIETLHATGEADQVHARHANYFLMLAEEASPALVGEGQESWLERLEADHENLRAALRWSLDHKPEMALRFVAALWRFWFVRGYLHEGKRWIERALTGAASAPTAQGVRALNGLGVLVWAAGDPERALHVQNVCLARAQESDNSWGVAVAQADRAFLDFVIHGETGRARLLAEEALDRARSLGDRHLEGVTLTTLGSIAASSGNASDAALHFHEALAIAMENGDSASQEFRRFKLGQLAHLTGDLERAAHFHIEALGIAERLNAREDLLHILAGIAGIAVDKQDYDRAARLLAATSALCETLDAILHPAEQARFDQDLAAVQDALPEATFQTAWEDGRGLSPAEAEKIARALPESSGQCTSGNGLSRRELEVLQMLANGASDREIAEALFISTETASTHVKNIRRKFGVRSRSAAAACGIRRALI